MGVSGGTNAHANHFAATVEIDANGLPHLGAEGAKALGEFGGGQAIAGNSLLVEPLELLEVTAFETF